MNKRIALIMLLITCAVTAFSQTTNETYYVSVNSLNVRTQPNTQSSIVTTVPKGTPLKVNSFTGAWVKVTVNDTLTGYVFKDYISKTKATTKQNESTVFVCNSKSSYAYHSHQCRGLKRCKSGISKVSKSQAQNSGYRACKICY